MDSVLTSAFTIFVSGAVLWLWVWSTNKLHGRRYLPFPPGPKPWPIIGNILDLPVRHAAKVYLEWAIRYNSELIHRLEI